MHNREVFCGEGLIVAERMRGVETRKESNVRADVIARRLAYVP